MHSPPRPAAEAAPAAPLRFLAAGLAAAAVTLSIPTAAEAGVVLVQPQVKNFVTDTPAAKAPANSSPAAKKAAAYKEESSSAGGLSFEAFRPLVLPASLLAIAGGGIVASKLDPEFAELFSREWSAKDNNITGTGYETTPGLKDTPFYGGSNTNGIDIKVGFMVGGHATNWFQQLPSGCFGSRGRARSHSPQLHAALHASRVAAPRLSPWLWC